jgi:hypothetical protein
MKGIVQMTDRRFRFGVGATCTWLGVMVWVALRRPELSEAMKPNEWGDFFAGFFAPMAFLWLILGYLQQGEELRLSTKALHLQADELRNSVDQQRELVEVTRQQVESDREALKAQLKVRRESAKPRFAVLNNGGSFSGEGNGTYNIVIANAGNSVRKVVGIFDEEIKGTRTLFDLALFPGGSEHRTALGVAEPLPKTPMTFRINYIDAEGLPGTTIFQVLQQSGVTNGALEFTEIEA